VLPTDWASTATGPEPGSAGASTLRPLSDPSCSAIVDRRPGGDPIFAAFRSCDFRVALTAEERDSTSALWAFPQIRDALLRAHPWLTVRPRCRACRELLEGHARSPPGNSHCHSPCFPARNGRLAASLHEMPTAPTRRSSSPPTRADARPLPAITSLPAITAEIGLCGSETVLAPSASADFVSGLVARSERGRAVPETRDVAILLVCSVGSDNKCSASVAYCGRAPVKRATGFRRCHRGHHRRAAV